MTAIRLLVMAFVLTVVGCGPERKDDVPKDLNKPLPPPPVAGGGGEKPSAKAPSQPKGSAD